MEVKKWYRNEWKEEMLDGIKKAWTVQSYIQRVQRTDGEGLGDCDNDACENEKDQKTINFSFHSENRIVGVVITSPEFCSVKLKIIYDKKSGS